MQKTLRSRPAAPSDVPALLQINNLVCPPPFKRRAADYFYKMLQKSAGNVFVLESNSGHVMGWAHCLPLTEAVSKSTIASSKDPGTLLSLGNVLDAREAMARISKGNVCWVGMDAIDPETSAERYNHAVPLFLELLWAFYRLWMRELFVHTKTELSANIARNAGAVKLRDLRHIGDGRSAIWHFDKTAASAHMASGLSVAFYTRWAAESSSSRLGLSFREREIVVQMMQGHLANDQLLRIFRISPDTLKSHLNNIFIKFRESGVVSRDWRGNRARVVQYCTNHPEEVRLIPRLETGADSL